MNRELHEPKLIFLYQAKLIDSTLTQKDLVEALMFSMLALKRSDSEEIYNQ